MKTYIEIEKEELRYRNAATNDHYIIHSETTFEDEAARIEIKVYHFMPHDIDNHASSVYNDSISFSISKDDEDIVDEDTVDMKMFEALMEELFSKGKVDTPFDIATPNTQKTPDDNLRIFMECSHLFPLDELRETKNAMFQIVFSVIHQTDIHAHLPEDVQAKIDMLCEIYDDIFFILDEEE